MFWTLIFFSLSIQVSCRSNIFNVRDYGAKGDGKTLDTEAIKKTFLACSQSGGGIVLLPAPGSYLTAPFNLTNHTELRVEKGAAILGAQIKDLYTIIKPLPSYGVSRDGGHKCRYQALIMGSNLTNVKLSGGGVIDGQGSYWWDSNVRKSLKCGRPRLIEILWSDDIEIFDINLKDPGFWCLHPTYCSNVHIHDVTIRAPLYSPNTDGIDPDSCSNVLIENCDIAVGDDHISIKSGMDDAGRSYNWPSKNITIRNCLFGYGFGVAIGSEMSGNVQDIHVHDCVMKLCHLVNQTHYRVKGMYMKSNHERGGIVENVRYENILISNSEVFLDIEIGDGTSTKHEPIIRDISYVNITGSALQHGRFLCLEKAQCHGFWLYNVSSTAREDWKCTYAYGKEDKTSPHSCLISESAARTN